MNTAWKNYLQEYCQKEKIPLPNYRIKQQSGPAHMLRFQVEVEVNGHWYIGDDLCSSKKDAEQSAARKAWEAITSRSPSTAEPAISGTLPMSLEVENIDIGYHLPDKDAELERFINDMIQPLGGRIRKIWPPNSHGRYTFEICGTYRYCEKIQRHHKKNQIYFIVDPITKTYIQKCHDPDCYGFQSTVKPIGTYPEIVPVLEQKNYVSQCPSCYEKFTYQISGQCERCGDKFCRKCLSECDYCHDAIHCNRCFDSCFDCHDS